MDKKTKVITFRTDEETRREIEKIAHKNKWSVAQTTDEICKEYIRTKSIKREEEEK